MDNIKLFQEDCKINNNRKGKTKPLPFISLKNRRATNSCVQALDSRLGVMINSKFRFEFPLHKYLDRVESSRSQGCQ